MQVILDGNFLSDFFVDGGERESMGRKVMLVFSIFSSQASFLKLWATAGKHINRYTCL